MGWVMLALITAGTSLLEVSVETRRKFLRMKGNAEHTGNNLNVFPVYERKKNVDYPSLVFINSVDAFTSSSMT